MGNITSIISQLSCVDVWRYVFNSMECHSHCCNEDGCECDCMTNEIDIPEEDDDCGDTCIKLISKLDNTFTSSSGDGSEYR